MLTTPAAVIRRAVGLCFLAVLTAVGSVSRAVGAQTGIVVRGITEFGLDNWVNEMRRAHVTFSVQNNTTQTVTLATSSEFYFEGGYYDESGNWVSGPALATSPASAVLAPGQTISVVVQLAFLYEVQADDIFLHLQTASGVPVYDGRAYVAGSVFSLDATFYAETSTPVFSPKPQAVTVAPTTTATSVNLQNRGDSNRPATYALTTNCASVGVSCTVPTSVTIGPQQWATVPISFSRGSFGTALPTFKAYATAPVNRSGVAERDSVAVSITFGDLAAPTLAIEPANTMDDETGEERLPRLMTRSAPVYVNACDSDGSVGQISLTLNGTAVTATDVATNLPGCFTSKRGTYVLPFASGLNTLVASVSDGVHTTTATQLILYDDAIDHTPVITALHPTSSVAINQYVTDTFLVRNPGWHAVQYASMWSSFCAWENPSGGYCAGLALQDTVTVAAGATVAVPVRFGTPSTQGRSERVTLRARYSSALGTVYGTGALVATAAPIVAPTVIIDPVPAGVVTTPTISLTVTWCDADDWVVQRSIAINGQDIGAGTDPGYGATANCLREERRRWTNLVLPPWQQNIITATGIDEQGHSTTVTSTVVYTPALSAFQPAVTPDAIVTRPVRPGIAIADTFAVRNAGQYAATYAILTSCKATSSCTTNKSAITLAPGESGPVIVSYTTPATFDVRDTIAVIARYTPPSGFNGSIADTASAVVVAPSIEAAPVVTAPATVSVLPPTYVGSFVYPITNHNTAPVTYTLSWSTTGGFGFPNWFTPPSSITVDAGETADVLIYTKAPAGDGISGTYTLMVSYVTTTGATLNGSAVAFAATQTPHASMALSPNNTTITANRGAQNQIQFNIASTGNTALLGMPAVRCTGLVLNCRFHSDPQYTVDVNPGQSRGVLVDFDLKADAAVGTLTFVFADQQTLGAPPDSATVTVRIDGPYASLAVTPKTAYAVGLSRAVTQQFTITNSGNTATTVSLAARCIGPALTCTASDAVRALGAGESTAMTVTGFSAGTLSLTGSMLVIASATNPNVTIDTGRVNITTANVAEVVVNARGASSGTTTARERCLTVAAGDASAYECGDLRLVHALPATTTMNKTRAPTLVYESRHHSALTLFPAYVRVAPGDTATSITAHVVIDGAPPVNRTFDWNPEWNTGNARRIVVPVDANALGIASGAHHYTLSVDVRSAQTSVPGQDTGTVAIVNRATSEFGAGWWLDGLEQLIPYTATEKLWIGGDGSTRLFTRQQSGTWLVTPSVDRVETLTTDGTFWYRWLPNKAYVQFDNAGRHVATVNAAGHRTSFVYNGPGGKLGRIDLPVPNGSSAQRSYSFNYDDNGVLASVDAPAAPDGPRHVRINHSDSRNISSIADPGSGSVDSVRFGYNSVGRIASRTNRRGDQTFYRYDAYTQALLADSISMERTSEPPIVTKFCPTEAASLADCASGPRDSATVITWVDGPRTSINDTTRFTLTRFGAPARIVNALGQTTTIEHTNAQWPVLATAVVSPNGHRVESTYDGRGLVSTILDRDPLGDGRNPLTQYKWNPIFDKPDTIITPGAEMRFGYFENGDRHWQEDGRGESSRVWFTYNGNRQLETILSPDNQPTGPKEIVAYDPVLGNLSRTTTAMEFITDHFSDGLGRDTLVVTEKLKVRTTYDILDQLRTSTSSEVGGTGNSLLVQNDYDPEGNLYQVTRSVDPDPLHLGGITLVSSYDALGRKLREYDPNRTQTGAWAYDAAGNVITIYRGVSSAISMEYDELNRMTRRVIPHVTVATETPTTDPDSTLTDDQRFDYDPSTGNLKSATNFAARIGRTYYPNGSLKTDTLRIASANLSEPEATRFNKHKYVVSYTYDPAGRRKTMTPPTGFGLTPVTYDYEPGSGALQRVSDGTFGTFRYKYTNAGLLDSLIQADGTREKHRYDVDGREIGRTEWNPASGTLHEDAASLDSRGKKLDVQSSGLGGGGSEFYTYDGLGGATSTRGRTFENTPRDALGNALSRKRSSDDYDEQYTYVAHTTQLRFITQLLDGAGTTDSVEQVHDETGDLIRSIERVTGPMLCLSTSGAYEPCPSGVGERRLVAESKLFNFYDNAGHLTMSRKETSNDDSGIWLSPALRGPNDIKVYPKFERGVTEEYRHDALGRRVWVRAHRNFYCPGANDRDSTSVCISTIERTVYDGDQVLVEIRQPGDDGISADILEADGTAAGEPAQHFGTVGYLHGPTIDHPLAVVRNYAGAPTPVVLHYQWLHGLDLSTRLDGSLMTPCTQPPCSGDQPDWAGRRMTYGFVIPSRTLGPVSWWGTMANMKQNATGGLDMRNRVYDPRTGRFTQEDPIGLAGGMNLYGFADGDPVNFSDPMGLCKDPQGNVRPADFCPETQGLKDVSWETFSVFLGGASLAKGLLEAGVSSAERTLGIEARKAGIEIGDDVSRVFGGDAQQMGRSWTTLDPRDVPNYAAQAGLPAGNTAESLVQGTLKSLRGIKVTRAAPGAQGPGGIIELVIPNPRAQVDVTSVRPFVPRVPPK